MDDHKAMDKLNEGIDEVDAMTKERFSRFTDEELDKAIARGIELQIVPAAIPLMQRIERGIFYILHEMSSDPTIVSTFDCAFKLLAAQTQLMYEKRRRVQAAKAQAKEKDDAQIRTN